MSAGFAAFRGRAGRRTGGVPPPASAPMGTAMTVITEARSSRRTRPRSPRPSMRWPRRSSPPVPGMPGRSTRRWRWRRSRCTTSCGRRHRHPLAGRGAGRPRSGHRADPTQSRRRHRRAQFRCPRIITSIINRFLPEIEHEFAKAKYVRFWELFLSAPLGLGPAVREYPHGADGPADVDSGPLPQGISLSATVVTLGAAKVNGDESPADGPANFGELAGLPLDAPSTRCYAFGVEPNGTPSRPGRSPRGRGWRHRRPRRRA